jgi:hypothetical protein
VRFDFRAIPAGPAGPARPRPIVDVVVEGLDLAPQACLLDSGALTIRMGRHVAELAGVDLAGAERARIAVGGALVEGARADVALEVGDGRSRHRWEAPVWFCDPWRPAFGLLGLAGFFDRFVVTIDCYAERTELRAAG